MIYGKHEMSVKKEFYKLLDYANKYKELPTINQRIARLKDIRGRMSGIVEENAELAENERWADVLSILDKKIEELEFENSLAGGEPEPASEPFTIDKRLDTDNARAMFNKFAEEGFIKINKGGHYKWLKTKTQFGYFITKASDYLELTDYDYKENTWFCRKPFEDLFKIYKTSSKKPPSNKAKREIDNTFSKLSKF